VVLPAIRNALSSAMYYPGQVDRSPLAIGKQKQMRFGIPADLNVTVVNPIINPMRVNVKGFGDQVLLSSDFVMLSVQ